MVALVELDAVKLRLNFDLDDHDDDLEQLIGAASEAVLNFLKLDHDYYDASDAEIPATVESAVIMLVGILKRDPSMTESEQWNLRPGWLPAPVVAILQPLRDPTLA